MKYLSTFRLPIIVSAVVVSLSFFQIVPGQEMDGIERGRMKDMLKVVKDEVKKNYYDTNYHGINLDEKFKVAEEKLAAAKTSSQALAIIAQVLMDFNDSHLFLIPPSTNLAVEYGWRMSAIGDKVYVTHVKPGSDAEAKGLKPGDQILSIGGFKPNKKELWKIKYYYNQIGKRTSLVLNVLSPGEDAPKIFDIKSQIKTLPRAISFSSYFRLFDNFYDEENDKHRFWSYGNTLIWRMPSFEFDPSTVDGLMERARNSQNLILDLRGNGGGYVKTLEALASNFFDKDVKIADLKGRKVMDPILAKARGKAKFGGRVIVLVDSESGSAAEIFARVMQIEQRGKVLGDVSAGAVMQSISRDFQLGTQSVVPFAVSVTNADVIMTNGKSLEHTGVIPDETVIPTGADLAATRDPVIVRALEMLGGKITPEEAGKLVKYYWKKD